MARELEPDRALQDFFERLHVTMCRPQLEFGVPVGTKTRDIIPVAREEVEPGDGLRVTAVEAFGEPQHGRELFHDAARLGRQKLEALV